VIALFISTALAGTITLDTGAVVEGDLAVYEHQGNCQVSVTDGGLQGSILVLPCSRLVAFSFDPVEAIATSDSAQLESEQVLSVAPTEDSTPDPYMGPESAVEVEVQPGQSMSLDVVEERSESGEPVAVKEIGLSAQSDHSGTSQGQPVTGNGSNTSIHSGREASRGYWVDDNFVHPPRYW
jgi:hypothetical protein